jgi:hypothetical protein
MALALPVPGSYRTKSGLEEDPHHHDDAAEEAERQAARRAEIRAENLGLCRSIMIFLVYIGVFTAAMFLESSDASSRFADHIRALLEGGGPNHHALMPLDRITSPLDVYDFLDQVFIPSLWENNTDTNQAIDEVSEYLHPIDISNRMIGSARVRQVRVKQESDCQVDPIFLDYTISCYPNFQPGGPLGSSNEAKDAFGPEHKYKYNEDPLGTGYSGSMGVYPAGGFMAYISTNRTMAELTVDMLRNEEFFGLETRAVFIDFLVWNSNLGVYAVSRIALEFGAAGAVATYLEVSILSENMLTAAGHGTMKDWCAFIGVIIVMMFVMYFFMEEAQEFYANKYSYFMDGWNVLDWVNMLLLMIAFIIRILVFVEAGDAPLGVPQLANKDLFSSIRSLTSKAETVRLLHSFNAVLLWGKCVKYLKHLPIVKVLVNTIWDAFRLFVPLMTMFTIALIGFGMAYNIGFGDKIQELTTFTRTIVYLTRSFLRDVKLMPVYYITPIFGAFLILLFYVMLVLVGVQVLFAIVTDAMYRSKHFPKEEDHEHKDEPLEEVLREGKKHGIKIIRMLCPIIYRNFIKKPMSKEERDKLIAARREEMAQRGEQERLALKNAATMDTLTESDYTASSEVKEKTFTTAEIMLAIQHMSGRVLSEVQEVGIEIRSELHDVCERVAQMQMAVEELSWRAELVRREQESVM